MNFEDMQSAWQQDKGAELTIPENLGQLKKARSPVEKVKRNIRSEMWTNLVFLVIFFALPFLFDRLIPQAQVFYYTILMVTLLPMSYYFYNFYKFYGRLSQLELNTKDSIDDAYFDLRYSIETYKIMQHFTAPNFFLMGLVFGLGDKIEKIIDMLLSFNGSPTTETGVALAIGVGILLVFVGFFYLIRFQVHYTYGKYLDEISKIRDSLKA